MECDSVLQSPQGDRSETGDANELLGSQSLRLVRWNAINYYMRIINHCLLSGKPPCTTISLWVVTYQANRFDLFFFFAMLYLLHELSFLDLLLSSCLPLPRKHRCGWTVTWWYCNLTSQKTDLSTITFSNSMWPDWSQTYPFVIYKKILPKKKKQRVITAGSVKNGHRCKLVRVVLGRMRSN